MQLHLLRQPREARIIKDSDGDGGTESYDAFRFCDTTLNRKISHGLHAVALDEYRADFSPTLWDADKRIKQIVFSGAHADVEGGYPENGLSQVTLQWMVDELRSLGLLVDNDRFLSLRPDPVATAHIPWKDLVYLHHERNFNGMTGYCSVSLREKAGPVRRRTRIQKKRRYRTSQATCRETSAPIPAESSAPIADSAEPRGWQ